jgi:pimeloyl-ACP methyl ester carboxylesterase
LPGSRLDLVWADALFRGAGLAVVAVDRPGFGGSSFERRRALLDWPGDVDGLADRLGLERFAVVGYSSRGKYAIACASSLPVRIWHGDSDDVALEHSRNLAARIPTGAPHGDGARRARPARAARSDRA